MSSFTTPLIVKLLPCGNRWEIMEPFIYYVGEEGSDEVISVPVGFTTDFATIPQILWSFIGGPTGKYGKAAVIHDYMLDNSIYPRKRCDEIFYEAMGVLGVPNRKRTLMYLGVRLNSIRIQIRDFIKKIT